MLGCNAFPSRHFSPARELELSVFKIGLLTIMLTFMLDGLETKFEEVFEALEEGSHWRG
jgi:hypothetical protein